MFFRGWDDAWNFPSVYGCPGGGKSLKHISSINSTYLPMCYLRFIIPKGYRWVDTKVYNKDLAWRIERRPWKLNLQGYVISESLIVERVLPKFSALFCSPSQHCLLCSHHSFMKEHAAGAVAGVDQRSLA